MRGGTETTDQQQVLDYVCSFRERLRKACACAQEALSSAQSKMKTRYDHKSVLGSALQAKFLGPYEIVSKISDTDYVLRTPDRRRETRVCHVNMLKSFISKEPEPETESVCPMPVASAAPVVSSYSPEEDGLSFRDVPVLCPRLPNSRILEDLPCFLSHLSDSCAKDVQRLIESCPGLFSDVPSRTNVLCHDIDGGDHLPIKQHAYRLNPTKESNYEF